MLCDRCKKNEATIHIETIHDGKRVKTNLCAECARHEEKEGSLAALGFNLAEVLFHQMSGKTSAPAPEKESVPGIVCPECGWTLEKIRRHNGQLGCARCYETFAPMISDVIGKVQKGGVHTGKRPGQRARADGAAKLEIERLKRLLDDAVRREEYENAARFRDAIRRLEEKSAASKAKRATKKESAR
ncbi:MAG: UvrB/UvrC motif-containing protein [Victivallaceae bacterium]|nr:UvrB/UvrC motif-containing protein [Victivallaceae bacterium]